jgi:hypothetical protein
MRFCGSAFPLRVRRLIVDSEDKRGLLLWVHFSAQILLVGAEFTCVYARTFGSRNAASAER